MLRPRFQTVQDAERAIIRWMSIGIVTFVLGLILFLAKSSGGLTLMSAGGVLVVWMIIWVVSGSRQIMVDKQCPRCSKNNFIFPNENYFKCTSCGYFAVLRDR